MIETERLTLIPLSYPQLLFYLRNDGSLENDLKINRSLFEVPDRLKEAFEKRVFPNVTDKNKNYLFYTLWVIILKKEKIITGGICFKGEPDEEMKVEIGYGTNSGHENKGYMSESVGGLVKWSKDNLQIRSIIAETSVNNPASIQILQKNHFVESAKNAAAIFWKLPLDNKEQ